MQVTKKILSLFLFFISVSTFTTNSLTQTESFLNVWAQKVWFQQGWLQCDGRTENHTDLIERMLRENYAFSSNSKFAQKRKGGILDADIPLYVDLIERMIEREREFENHFVFYHGYSDDTDLLFDFQTVLKKQLHLFPDEQYMLQLRFYNYVNHNNIEDFIDYWDDKFKYGDYFRERIYADPELQGIPIKWSGYVRPLPYQALPVNFCPLSNTGYIGKGSLYYVIRNRNVMKVKKILAKLFEDFGFDKKYMETIRDLHKAYIRSEKGGHMLQIFIPKHKKKVNEFIFLALPYGTPFRQEITGLQYDYLRMRHKNVSEFLEKYITDPLSLKIENSNESAEHLINRIEGRIVFLPDFYDPANGIKIFRYDFASEQNREKYYIELDKIVCEMMR